MAHWVFTDCCTSLSFLPYSTYLADCSLQANYNLAQEQYLALTPCTNVTQLLVLYQLPKQYLVQTSPSGLSAPGNWQDRSAMHNA